MRAYAIRRLLLMVPTMFLVTIIIFTILRFIPGDVIDLMVAEMGVEAAGGAEITAAAMREMLGLDVPIYTQYWNWLGGAVQGDLGNSLWTGRSVTEDIFNRLPVSMELGILAIIVGLIVALPIGIYSAIRQDTPGDYIGRTFAILCISLPSFWTGTMIVVYPSIYLNWSPPVIYIPLVQDPLANLAQFILPAIVLGMIMSGTTMRMTRTMMLEVLRQDYIRTAWSKGLTERAIILRHALKNALIPVVTIVGMMLPIVIGGAIVTEQIFCLPGIGMLMVEALNKRDYPVISGINVVLASFVMVINLVIDLTYAWLDPRVTYK